MALSKSPLIDAAYPDWDAHVARSQEAWFFQTTAWMRYTREYAACAFRENVSFWVVEGAARLAAVPAFIEEGPQGFKLAYAGAPLPAPVLDPSLGPEKRLQVLRFAEDQLWELAERSGIEEFQWCLAPLAPAVVSSSLPPANPFMRLGCLDLPFQSQIIDLRPEEGELWRQVRHGHRYDIRRAEKSLESTVWTGKALSDEKFGQYQRLHAKDAGRVTRSQATFDLMKEWIRGGNGLLVEASLHGEPVSFAMILIYGKGALYASAAKDPDRPDLPGSHLAQWRTIRWLKENGIWFYNLGLQQYGPQWFERPSAKELGIARFKRGFGGTAVPQFTAEFHRSEAGLRRAVEERLSRFLPREATMKAVES